MPNDQIVATTYAHFTDTDEGGIRNQEKKEIKTKTSTPLIEDLEISDIFKDKNDEEGNSVMDELIIEVL